VKNGRASRRRLRKKFSPHSRPRASSSSSKKKKLSSEPNKKKRMASRSETVEAVLFALCVGFFFGASVALQLESELETIGFRDGKSKRRERRWRSIELPIDLVCLLSTFSTSSSPLNPPRPTNPQPTNRNSLPRLHLLPAPLVPQIRLPRPGRRPRRALKMARRRFRGAQRQRDPDLRRPVDPQLDHGRVFHGLDVRADRRVRAAAGHPGRGEDREAEGAGRARPDNQGAERFVFFASSLVAQRRVQAERDGATSVFPLSLFFFLFLSFDESKTPGSALARTREKKRKKKKRKKLTLSLSKFNFQKTKTKT